MRIHFDIEHVENLPLNSLNRKREIPSPTRRFIQTRWKSVSSEIVEILMVEI
jgi:hypothetical protein